MKLSSKGAIYLGVSVYAVCAVIGTGVLAQDAAPTSATAEADSQEVVVVGTRKSLKNAQQIKKDADTVVDSITATDIGSFPDKSVAEALQRVAGITVNRFAATGDTSHFSAEPSGVIVRGLSQVRPEFNGRDIFTADSSRGLSWSDVSPELMSGVDVYKNQTAELIEGGIAGTINLKTRLPFDQKGRLLAVSSEYAYGDLAQRGDWSFSGIYSDRFQTNIGEFGIMLNAAHSGVVTNSQGIQFERINPVSNASAWGDADVRYLPRYAAVRNNIYDRVRDGIAAAAQWRNNEGNLLVSLQYNQSKKREQFDEYVIKAYAGLDVYGKPVDFVYTSDAAQCLGGASKCTFNDDGSFQSGTLVNSNNAWYGSIQAPPGATASNGLFRACYSWEEGCSGPQRNAGYENTTRYSDSLNDTSDLSLNAKWYATDRLSLNFDVQYVKATQTNYDIEAALYGYADVFIDNKGDRPRLAVSPSTAAGWNLAPGGISSPWNYHVDHFMDHVTDSEGQQFAARADLAYSFDSPWLNSLKAGIRFADRDQTVRWSAYNWASVVNTWSNYNADDFFVGGSAFPDKNAYGLYTFGKDFYDGKAINSPAGVFFNVDTLKNQQALADSFGRDGYQPMSDGSNTNAWTPICERSGVDAHCMLPSEIADVSEKTKAAYIQLKFGGNDATIFNGITVNGNIGIRYVETLNESSGGVNYNSNQIYDWAPLTANPQGVLVPSISYYVDGLIGTPPPVTAAPPASGEQASPEYIAQVAAASAYVNNPANFTGDRAFMKANTDRQSTSIVHKNWLPSFNVRFGLTDKWFLRFAASRAMSRPDIGNLKSYTSIAMELPSTTQTLDCNPTTGAFICNSSGDIVKTKINRFSGTANNPFLKPVTADQVDLSIENYFSPVGSFTLNLFYKKFHDYIQNGNYTRSFTNNGETRDVEITGPINGEGASVKGFEVAYQTFFDSLPAPFDGLGVQANWTHLNNSGVKNSGVFNQSADGTASSPAKNFTDLPLEGLSDDTANFVGMYEKGPFSARLAYNWRSEYLVSVTDCCTQHPAWQEAAGYLDGRVAYRINSNIELSLEGSNLLNTETVLTEQVDGPLPDDANRKRLLIRNAWFQNDRRIQVSIRMKY